MPLSAVFFYTFRIDETIVPKELGKGVFSVTLQQAAS
jgi:hypothetical protein